MLLSAHVETFSGFPYEGFVLLQLIPAIFWAKQLFQMLPNLSVFVLSIDPHQGSTKAYWQYLSGDV